MSWETRANGKRYYTRSRRKGGRVLREYIGRGTVGELAEMSDAMERQEKQFRSLEIKEVIREANEFDRKLVEFESIAETIGRGLLIAAGYYQHNRCEWRKRSEKA